MKGQPIESVHTIVLHHSASRRDVLASTIRQWHLEKGWSDIGYHMVVEGDATLVRGRPLDRVPAAQRGKNTGTWAVCLVGDNTVDSRGWSQEQIDAAAEALEWLHWLRGKRLPVVGHRDLASTLCPGLDISDLGAFA